MYQLPGAPIIASTFLYKQLYLRAANASKEGELSIEVRKGDVIQKILTYVGHSSIQDFERLINQEIHPALLSCIGYWYYYARESSGDDVLLRSPVRIWEEGNRIFIELYGKYRSFLGEVKYKSGGVFCLLIDEEEEKQMHIIFHLGIQREPEVLEGVFSGWSSRNIPVAGRAFLVHQETQDYSSLSTGKLDLANEPIEGTMSDGWPAHLIKELKDYTGNYVRVVVN